MKILCIKDVFIIPNNIKVFTNGKFYSFNLKVTGSGETIDDKNDIHIVFDFKSDIASPIWFNLHFILFHDYELEHQDLIKLKVWLSTLTIGLLIMKASVMGIKDVWSHLIYPEYKVIDEIIKKEIEKKGIL